MSKVVIYTTNDCPFCVNAKNLFKKLDIPFEEISLENNHELRQQLSRENRGWRTVPMIFINEKFVGGFDDVNKLNTSGELKKLLEK